MKFIPLYSEADHEQTKGKVAYINIEAIAHVRESIYKNVYAISTFEGAIFYYYDVRFVTIEDFVKGIATESMQP